jgi:hypothetical protein
MAWAGLGLLGALVLLVNIYERERRQSLTEAERAEEDEYVRDELNTW